MDIFLTFGMYTLIPIWAIIIIAVPIKILFKIFKK